MCAIPSSAALAVNGNVNKLMMIVRRNTGHLELLNIEQSIGFFRNFDREVETVISLQVRPTCHSWT